VPRLFVDKEQASSGKAHAINQWKMRGEFVPASPADGPIHGRSP
jgi:hypothetical protein